MAARIWHVLVTVCGARDSRYDHYAFVDYLDGAHPFQHEWRFSGSLGFGGKFYNDGFSWRVGCYPEDRTPQRDEAIHRANQELAALRAVYLADDLAK